MLRSLYTASSGMQAQQFYLDNISNNLANVNTTGFKKTRVDFQNLLYQNLRTPGANATNESFYPTGIQLGGGVRVAGTITEYTQGNLQQTGRNLDLAIEGNGFFSIELPTGEIAYSRNGSMNLDSEGYLVTSEGYRVLDEIDNPIQMDSFEAIEELTVNETGVLAVKIAGEAEFQEIGTLALARFVNPAGLEKLSNSLVKATQASGEAVVGAPGDEGLGLIKQGFLESSNVAVVEEMVKMITAQRTYELNSKVVQTSDEMMGITNSLRR